MIRIVLLALCCAARGDTPAAHPQPTPSSPVGLGDLGVVLGSAIAAAAGAFATGRRKQPHAEQLADAGMTATLARVDERTEALVDAHRGLADNVRGLGEDVRSLRKQHHATAQGLTRLLMSQGEAPIPTLPGEDDDH